jgi:hypothetical protein
VPSNRIGLRYYTRTYWADGGKQPLARTFLGRDPDSSRENKDTRATMAGRPSIEADACALSPPPHRHDSPVWEGDAQTGQRTARPLPGGV